MRVWAAIILAAFAFASPVRAEAVVWLMPAYPPAFILDLGEAGSRWRGGGFAQQMQAWFIKHIPGYESETLEASISRIMTLMQAGDRLYCLATTNQTQARAAFMTFSATLYLQPSNRIVVQTDRSTLLSPYLDTTGAVDLSALLRDLRIGGSIASGRAYSAAIDRALAAVPELDRQSSIETPPKLLLAGRTDWIIAYPRELEWAWRAGGGDADAEDRPYRAYPIVGEPPFVANHIGCTKNAAGQRFIEKIDKTIAANPDRPWRLFMLAWLDRADRAAVEAAEPVASPLNARPP